MAQFIVPPNGAGKNIIVRAILGTLKPRAGESRFRPRGSGTVRIGYVPQRDSVNLVLPYTVGEVVLMGRYRDLGLLRRPGAEDLRATEEALDHVGLSGVRGHPLRELSGGQRQPVLIVRALASRPELLILDEPTNGMDLSSKSAILDLIARLHEEDRLTIVMMSHLLDDVANSVRNIAIVDREFFPAGAGGGVLTPATLSALYRMQVRVESVGGSTVILPGEQHGNS